MFKVKIDLYLENYDVKKSYGVTNLLLIKGKI